MERVTKEVLERFNSYVRKTRACHIWVGNKDVYGYGIFFFYKKNRKAHRFIYYATEGGIKDGMFIDHKCRRRDCVNPKHLREVTPRQNVLENSESVGAINAKKTVCKKGHVFDRVYGGQRYCSICENEKSKRLSKKWLKEANTIKC